MEPAAKAVGGYMLNKEPGPERARLGFKEAVLTAFEFLSDLGLHIVEEKPTFVRYESSDVFVNVYHGRASFELGAEIGRLKQPDEEKLAIYDIVAWADAEKAEGFGQHVMFQVSLPEGVGEFVRKLARLVQRYGPPFLKGDATAFRAALEVRSRVAADYVKQMNLRGIHQKAETAWHAKNYGQVVELYGPVRKYLTEVEAKKLAYAEQQLIAVEGVGSRSSRKRH
jgi:hypothetical protein